MSRTELFNGISVASSVEELQIAEPKISDATKCKLLEDIEEESQVVVHLSFTADNFAQGIRIWKSTFLYPHNSDRRSRLLHSENIAIYPSWTLVAPHETVHFTLFFSSLPKDCTAFDLIEKIPESGAFELRNIKRNENDVYHLNYS